jgi:hypothetical protein
MRCPDFTTKKRKINTSKILEGRSEKFKKLLKAHSLGLFLLCLPELHQHFSWQCSFKIETYKITKPNSHTVHTTVLFTTCMSKASQRYSNMITTYISDKTCTIWQMEPWFKQNISHEDLTIYFRCCLPGFHPPPHTIYTECGKGIIHCLYSLASL